MVCIFGRSQIPSFHCPRLQAFLDKSFALVACLRGQWAFRAFFALQTALSAIIPIRFPSYRSSRVPAGMYAFSPVPPDLIARTGCMHCMQSKTHLCTLCGNTTPKKTAYNAYKKTIWLGSRAEDTKMYAYGNAYRLHTKCIQAHKKSKKREFLFLLSFYIACSFHLHCPRFRAIVFRLFALSGIHGPHRAILKRHQTSLSVFPDRGQSARSNHSVPPAKKVCMHCMQSKTNLCTLNENTTPELTAYNAYKNGNRRVRRAERLKMYAYTNAYGTHTKCIQARTGI